LPLHTVTSFATPDQADAATRDLLRDGFEMAQIGVMMNEDVRTLVLEIPEEDRAGEASVAGGVLGTVVGGIVGLAVAGPPGVIAGGALVALLGGSLTGGLAGSLLGALTGLGIPADQTDWFARRLQAGDVLISVTTEDTARATVAERVLERHRPATPVATFTGGTETAG